MFYLKSVKTILVEIKCKRAPKVSKALVFNITYYAVSNLLAYSARASANQGGSGGQALSLDAVSPG